MGEYSEDDERSAVCCRGKGHGIENDSPLYGGTPDSTIQGVFVRSVVVYEKDVIGGTTDG